MELIGRFGSILFLHKQHGLFLLPGNPLLRGRGAKVYVSDFNLVLADENTPCPESKMSLTTSQPEAGEILQQFEFL